MAGALGVILVNEAVLRVEVTWCVWHSRSIEKFFALMTEFFVIPWSCCISPGVPSYKEYKSLCVQATILLKCHFL